MGAEHKVSRVLDLPGTRGLQKIDLVGKQLEKSTSEWSEGLASAAGGLYVGLSDGPLHMTGACRQFFTTTLLSK
jgi:hypothetical protein